VIAQLFSKDGSSPANLQVGKGGLPPLERQRRDRFDSTFKQLRQFHPVAPLALERGQAHLPNLQITAPALEFSHRLGSDRLATQSEWFHQHNQSLDAVSEPPHLNRRLSLTLALLLICASLTFVACKREQRQFEPPPPNPNPVITMSELRPGAQPEPPIKNPAEDTAYSLSEGKRLYTSYNCSGCHFNGGGGIGPALMDEKWIYGSEPANVYATIVEGRPNGMPSFRHKISDYQVWEIAGYVRSLSGQLGKNVSPGRSNDMNAHKSEQTSKRKTPQASGVPKSAEQP